MIVLDPLSNNVLFGRLLVGALHAGRPTGELPTGCHVRAGQGGRTVAGEHVAKTEDPPVAWFRWLCGPVHRYGAPGHRAVVLGRIVPGTDHRRRGR